MGSQCKHARLAHYHKQIGSPGNELIRQFYFLSFSTGASLYLEEQFSLRLHIPKRNHTGFKPTSSLWL
jgi:hypothetical protein